MTVEQHTPSSVRRIRALLGLIAAACLAVVLAVPGTASADFDVTEFSNQAYDSSAQPEDRAGVHPFTLVNTIKATTTTSSQGFPIPDGNLKDVIVDLPNGFAGNPENVPQCDPMKIMGASLLETSCEPATQVGVIQIDTTLGSFPLPVFNLVPPPNVPAQFGFNVVAVPIYINATVRPEDHGLRMKILNTSSAMPVTGTTLTLWGVPADPAHDAARGVPSPAPLRPFLSNPTDCSAPQETKLRINSWQDQDWVERTYTAGTPTECEAVDFQPDLDVEPSHIRAASPAGYHVELTIAQNDASDGRKSADLKDAVVTLPEAPRSTQRRQEAFRPAARPRSA